MVKSVQKAVNILFELANDPERAMPLNKIASKLKLNKSTCARILDTLSDSLLVERVSRRDGYRLGPGAYMLTRYGRYQESLIEICSPVIRWARREVDATVFLTVVCDGVKYIIYHLDSDENLDCKNCKIIQGDIENTATGILMMAYMDESSLERVKSRSPKRSVYDIERDNQQKKLFQKIRMDNYVQVDVKEEGRQAFAFRIWDGVRTVASIGFLYSNQKDSQEMRKHVIAIGKKAANEISRRLSFKNENMENYW